MLASIGMAFLHLNQETIGDWIRAPFAGLFNFHIALSVSSPIAGALLHSFVVTVLYTAAVVLASWLLGLVGAVFLSDTKHFRRLLGSLFIVPYALPAFASVLVWTFMFQPRGAINTLLSSDLHIVGQPPYWLAGSQAFWAITSTTIWRDWPFAFLLMFAGVQGVAPELYEAARVDGASRWREFLAITLPSLRRVSLLLVLIIGFWSFTDFTTPFLMLSSAAPASANLLSLEIYNTSFVDLNFGLGAAMSSLMVAFMIGASALYLRILRVDIGGALYD